MDPIAFIVPVGPSIEGPRKTYEAPADGPSMEALTERFQALMHQDAHTADPQQGTNGITGILTRQEDLMRMNEEHARGMREAMPYMTAAEMNASSVQLTQSVSLSNFKLTAAASLGSAAGKSLQALLKNS